MWYGELAFTGGSSYREELQDYVQPEKICKEEAKEYDHYYCDCFSCIGDGAYHMYSPAFDKAERRAGAGISKRPEVNCLRQGICG